MPIYLPKQIFDIHPTKEHPLIFLAGPIRGGDDWQAGAALTALRFAPGAHVICPCRWTKHHPLAAHFKQSFSDAAGLPRQRRWEEHYLERAAMGHSPGCVLFWLPLESNFDKRDQASGPYAMDTRRELGKMAGWLRFNRNLRLVLGGDRRFPGLDVILDDLAVAGGRDFEFHESTASTVVAAIEESVK